MRGTRVFTVGSAQLCALALILPSPWADSGIRSRFGAKILLVISAQEPYLRALDRSSGEIFSRLFSGTVGYCPAFTIVRFFFFGGFFPHSWF